MSVSDISSGHDLAVCGFEPRVGLCAEPGACFGCCVSLSLCPSPAHAWSLSVSTINKKLKKKKSLHGSTMLRINPSSSRWPVTSPAVSGCCHLLLSAPSTSLGWLATTSSASACCSSNVPGTAWPWGLCACCFLLLLCTFPSSSPAWLLLSISGSSKRP